MKYVLIVMVFSFGQPTGTDVYGVFNKPECEYAKEVIRIIYESEGAEVASACKQIIERLEQE